MIQLNPSAYAETPAQTAAAPGEAAMAEPDPLTHLQGMWVWRASWIDTDQAQDELLAFCERHGFNRLLMQVHDVKGAETYTIRYPQELARLIREAAKRGIVVEALDGDKDMALAENHDKSLQQLQVLIDFNQSLPEGERFAGVHYDIEPYIMERWKEAGESRRVVMHDLLDFYAKARQMLDERGSKMLLACDIPMWYDNKTDPNDNCILEYNGQTKNLHMHIQDICDYIGIMSYRTKAVGPNSVTQMIANELDYAESIGKKVCASLETIDLPETPQITFYGSTPEVFWEQFNLVKSGHEQREGFAGMLVHCYRGARELLKP